MMDKKELANKSIEELYDIYVKQIATEKYPIVVHAQNEKMIAEEEAKVFTDD